MELDKDLLLGITKIYSPETCIFIPSYINKLFNIYQSKETVLPVGVYKTPKHNYTATVTINGKNKHLGTYPTSKQAFEVYKKAKEAHIIEVATKYKDKIPLKLYNAILNYKVEIEL